METQIQSYSFSKRDGGVVTLFGYATKSLPGLEINGLGKYGKTLKEKIIFLTRSRRLAVPLNRFVISTEYEVEQDPELLRWLDLPVLLLYWYLAGLLPMRRLDNCLAVGHITPSGVLIGPDAAELLVALREHNLLWVGSPPVSDGEEVASIDPQELLGHVPQLEFRLGQSSANSCLRDKKRSLTAEVC